MIIYSKRLSWATFYNSKNILRILGMIQKEWQVYKFGGSSMKDAEALKEVGNLVINSDSENLIVVVSAMSGMTDNLLTYSESRDEGILESIEARYFKAIEYLLVDENDKDELVKNFHSDLEEIIDIASDQDYASISIEENEVLGFGELWSSRLLHAYIASLNVVENSWLNPMKFLVIQNEEMGANVNWEKSKLAFEESMQEKIGKIIMGGFIGSNENGQPTNLGRNGSDYSASILGSLSDASSVTIWTDVDGVLTGDPKVVPEAKIIKKMSYDEAIELSYFGAEVIHPKTMSPLMKKEIPLFIKNTFNPQSTGTCISNETNSSNIIKGITTIKDIALINLEGTGMIGVPGIVKRLGNVLQESKISIILISQASSEHSICFAVHSGDVFRASEVIKKEFNSDFENGNLNALQIEEDCSILAIVGSGMTGSKGIAAKFFNAISLSKTNVIAIAQGSSEKNISVVIKNQDINHAMLFVHNAFFKSTRKIGIAIMGYGSIGQELHKQILSEKKIIRDKSNITLDVIAISNSQKMILSSDCINQNSAKEVINKAEELADNDINAMITHMTHQPLSTRVIIDCSASDNTPNQYPNIFAEEINIVTANKKGLSGDMERYQSIMRSKEKNDVNFLYETTAGAALPFIKSISDITGSGDSIRKIEGIFSGTLAYLFNTFDENIAFSKLVEDALKQGFTEPDPRDDLSGMDVARKLVILAREMGIEIDVSDIDVESLVHPDHISLSVEDYLHAMESEDKTLNNRYLDAVNKKEKLAYVAQLDQDGNASVNLNNLKGDHPFSGLKGTENIIAIYSDFYSEYPLVLRGPGAGREVTASGLFFDLMTIIRKE